MVMTFWTSHITASKVNALVMNQGQMVFVAFFKEEAGSFEQYRLMSGP